MTNLQAQLDAAEAEVARLKRAIGNATCAEIGSHDWEFIGGKNAGCDRNCNCSVPVHTCTRCGDCDYGDTDEAREIREECRSARELAGVSDE